MDEIVIGIKLELREWLWIYAKFLNTEIGVKTLAAAEAEIELQLNFSQWLAIYEKLRYTHKEESLRYLIAAMQVADGWWRFSNYKACFLPFINHEEVFLRRALDFADTVERCRCVFQWSDQSKVGSEAVEKMATLAKTVAEWKLVASLAWCTLPTKAIAERKVAELSGQS